jgi:hypothetical protein
MTVERVSEWGLVALALMLIRRPAAAPRASTLEVRSLNGTGDTLLHPTWATSYPATKRFVRKAATSEVESASG